MRRDLARTALHVKSHDTPLRSTPATHSQRRRKHTGPAKRRKLYVRLCANSTRLPHVVVCTQHAETELCLRREVLRHFGGAIIPKDELLQFQYVVFVNCTLSMLAWSIQSL